MRRRPRLTREGEIARVRAALLRDSFPRLQMLLLVSATGGSGFAASFVMLQFGISGMALRYTLAMLCAYLAFLGLLWIWLRFRADDFLDADPGAALDLPLDAASMVDQLGSFSGRGGSFDGGGASANYAVADPGELALASADDSASIGDKLSALGEADEAAIPIAVIVLVSAIVLSSLFVIYSAPLLFAEIVVDGVLSASLYRRLRGLEAQHWITTAIRRTIWPFALTTIVVFACGWSMQAWAPGAHSLGEVLQHGASAAGNAP